MFLALSATWIRCLYLIHCSVQMCNSLQHHMNQLAPCTTGMPTLVPADACNSQQHYISHKLHSGQTLTLSGPLHPADVRISLQHYITARDACGLHSSASAPPGGLPGSPLSSGQGLGPAGSPCLRGPCYSPHSRSLDALAAAAETTHPLAAAALAAGAAAAATHGYGSAASRASLAAAGGHSGARGDRPVHGCGGCGSPAFPQQGPAGKGWLPPASVCLAGGGALMPPPSTAALLEVAPLDIRLTPPPPSPHAGGSPPVHALAA